MRSGLLIATGNEISSAGVFSGTNATLESYELSFHQDLNGDGIIGPPPPITKILESFGSTSLVEVGNNYFLNSISSGTGPELTQNGSPVTVGQFGTWTPIGAEQISSGYEVAWKAAGADQYAIWTTDSNGNEISSAGVFSGANATLESFELSFHQDLNGDGIIGPLPATITGSANSATKADIFASNGTESFIFREGIVGGMLNDASSGFLTPNVPLSKDTEALAALLHESAGTEPHLTMNGHTSVADHAHSNAAQQEGHLADLHAGGFIFR